MRSALLDIPVAAGLVKRPSNPPNLSISALFKGREAELEALVGSFGAVLESGAAPVVARVLDGLGGVGKTRLALEYAWRRAGTTPRSSTSVPTAPNPCSATWWP